LPLLGPEEIGWRFLKRSQLDEIAVRIIPLARWLDRLG
jgi:hypothetical protein